MTCDIISLDIMTCVNNDFISRQYIVTTPLCDTTSKQNLETIVEAIRHLEGDHLFSEEAGPHQVSGDL